MTKMKWFSSESLLKRSECDREQIREHEGKVIFYRTWSSQLARIVAK